MTSKTDKEVSPEEALNLASKGLVTSLIRVGEGIDGMSSASLKRLLKFVAMGTGYEELEDKEKEFIANLAILQEDILGQQLLAGEVEGEQNE